MVPKVEFRYSWVYDEGVRNSSLMKKHLMKNKEKYPSVKSILKYKKEIKNIWKKEGKIILRSIEKFSGLKWKDQQIKVYLRGRGACFSDPLTVSICKDKTLFIDILIHELIHVIQSQDYKQTKEAWIAWGKYIKKKHDKEEKLTKNHIFLHAVHKEIYLRVFDKKRLQRDIKRMKNNLPYKRSWEIVEKEGHENIIKKFKEGFK